MSDEKIQPKSSARNLGVTIDQCLDLTDHVKKICVSCHCHLRNITKIRKYLSEETSEILVHAFISSKLDNCNSLLYGLPQHLLNRILIARKTRENKTVLLHIGKQRELKLGANVETDFFL